MRWGPLLSSSRAPPHLTKPSLPPPPSLPQHIPGALCVTRLLAAELSRGGGGGVRIHNLACDGFTSRDVLCGEPPRISVTARARDGDPFPSAPGEPFAPLDHADALAGAAASCAAVLSVGGNDVREVLGALEELPARLAAFADAYPRILQVRRAPALRPHTSITQRKRLLRSFAPPSLHSPHPCSASWLRRAAASSSCSATAPPSTSRGCWASTGPSQASPGQAAARRSLRRSWLGCVRWGVACASGDSVASSPESPSGAQAPSRHPLPPPGPPPPPLPPHRQVYAPVLALARTHGLPVVDLASSFDPADAGLFRCQIEPSHRGGARIARLVAHACERWWEGLHSLGLPLSHVTCLSPHASPARSVPTPLGRQLPCLHALLAVGR